MSLKWVQVATKNPQHTGGKKKKNQGNNLLSARWSSQSRISTVKKRNTPFFLSFKNYNSTMQAAEKGPRAHRCCFQVKATSDFYTGWNNASVLPKTRRRGCGTRRAAPPALPSRRTGRGLQPALPSPRGAPRAAPRPKLAETPRSAALPLPSTARPWHFLSPSLSGHLFLYSPHHHLGSRSLALPKKAEGFSLARVLSHLSFCPNQMNTEQKEPLPPLGWRQRLAQSATSIAFPDIYH